MTEESYSQATKEERDRNKEQDYVGCATSQVASHWEQDYVDCATDQVASHWLLNREA